MGRTNRPEITLDKNWGKRVDPGVITWEQQTIKLYGKEHKLPRLTAWYSPLPYKYAGIVHPPQEFTLELSSILRQVNFHLDESFNSILCNLYRDGHDSVSWHSDDEKDIDHTAGIASLSFGASRDFVIKHKETGRKRTIGLNNGDLLYMSPGFQQDYLHCLPKRTRCKNHRINLTFRKQLDL